MSKDRNNENPILSPRMFDYRGMKCACIEISGVNVDHALFELYVGAEKAFQIIEQIPKDSYFKVLVAMLYDLSIREMECRIIADEPNDDFHFYISCYTMPSRQLLQAYAQNPELALFATDAARHSTKISSFDQPFNTSVSVRDETIDVNGFMHAQLLKPLHMDRSYRFFYPYGVSYNINVTNEFELADKLDDEDIEYSIWNHVDLFTNQLDTMIRTMEKRLTRILSPTEILEIGYDTLFIADQPTEAMQYAISIREILIPKVFNGMTIRDISPTNCVIAPKDETFFSELGNIHIHRCLGAIEHIMTALMSTNDMLYIPKAVEYDIKWIDNHQYLDVHFIPHMCRFNNDAVFSTMQNSLAQNCANEFFWILNETEEVTFSFPTGAYNSDVCSLGYLRFNRLWADSNRDAFAALIYSMTSDKTRLRIVQETEMWTFCSIDVVEADDMEPAEVQGREYFNPRFIGDIGLKSTTNSIENVMMAIYSLLFDNDYFYHALENADPKTKEALIRKAGSEDIAICMLYEESVHLSAWSFYQKAVDARNHLHKTIEAEVKKRFGNTQVTTKPQIVHDDKGPTSPVISEPESNQARPQKASVLDRIRKWFS